MILFFRTPSKSVIAVESNHQLTPDESNKLCWLFGEAVMESEENLKGCFVGPRREMITPWSTNAVEITQNMGLEGISRIEEYFPVKDENADYTCGGVPGFQPRHAIHPKTCGCISALRQRTGL